VKAKNLDDLLVYQHAEQAADAISALLKRTGLGKDFELRDQLSRSSARVAPLIGEGFGQVTDRHLAVYLGRARGSALETRAHLRVAAGRAYITETELRELCGRYDAICKMLTSWINYLHRSDWKDRR
jgi:four helix bundle protein